jgi:hypothetical protein
MIWLFERGDDVTRVETRFDSDSGEYVAEIAWADGQTQTERFRDYATFHARVITLEQQLATEQWALKGPPTMISDAWKV